MMYLLILFFNSFYKFLVFSLGKQSFCDFKLLFTNFIFIVTIEHLVNHPSLFLFYSIESEALLRLSLGRLIK